MAALAATYPTAHLAIKQKQYAPAPSSALFPWDFDPGAFEESALPTSTQAHSHESFRFRLLLVSSLLELTIKLASY